MLSLSPTPNAPMHLPMQGLTVYQQLVAGQPAWLTCALEDRMGKMMMGLPQLAILLVASVFALWHLRTWWAANIEVAR
jgi:hypothetical protein